MSTKIQKGGLDGMQGFFVFIVFAGIIAAIVVPIVIKASKKKEGFEGSGMSTGKLGVIIGGVFVGIFLLMILFMHGFSSSH